MEKRSYDNRSLLKVGEKIVLAVLMLSLLMVHTTGIGMNQAYASTNSAKGVLQGGSSVDLRDVQTVLKAYLRLVTLTSEQLELLGLDPSVDVTLADVQNLLMRVLGLSVPVYHKTVSMLFVGNSFTYFGDVPAQVKALSKMYGVKVNYSTVVRGGAALWQLKGQALDEIRKKKFDYVVLQEHGQIVVEAFEGYMKDVKELCDEAKRSGATPVIYNPAGMGININGRPSEMQGYFTMLHEIAAYENNAIMLNAADAWVYVYMKLLNASLYLPNDYHANDAGAYLTACVFVSTLFDLHVKDVAIHNLYHGNSAISLGQAAWEFVSFYKENGYSPDDVIVVPPGKNIKVND